MIRGILDGHSLTAEHVTTHADEKEQSRTTQQNQDTIMVNKRIFILRQKDGGDWGKHELVVGKVSYGKEVKWMLQGYDKRN